jgi:hypothetical protein
MNVRAELRRRADRRDRCEVCGSELATRSFRVVVPHWQGTFDCIECALTVAGREQHGVGRLTQAEELAAELFVARLPGGSARPMTDALDAEVARLKAQLEEERLKALELERELDVLANRLDAAADAEPNGHAVG